MRQQQEASACTPTHLLKAPQQLLLLLLQHIQLRPVLPQRPLVLLQCSRMRTVGAERPSRQAGPGKEGMQGGSLVNS